VTDTPFLENQMGLIINCQADGYVEVEIGHNFSEDMDDLEVDNYLDLLSGLNALLEHHSDFVAHFGHMTRTMQAANEASVREWGEVLDAPSGDVLPFTRKKMN
jgi:hypothetical protein